MGSTEFAVFTHIHGLMASNLNDSIVSEAWEPSSPLQHLCDPSPPLSPVRNIEPGSPDSSAFDVSFGGEDIHSMALRQRAEVTRITARFSEEQAKENRELRRQVGGTTSIFSPTG